MILVYCANIDLRSFKKLVETISSSHKKYILVINEVAGASVYAKKIAPTLTNIELYFNCSDVRDHALEAHCQKDRLSVFNTKYFLPAMYIAERLTPVPFSSLTLVGYLGHLESVITKNILVNNIEKAIFYNVPHDTFSFLLFSLLKLKGVTASYYTSVTPFLKMLVYEWQSYDDYLPSAIYSPVDWSKIKLHENIENELSARANDKYKPFSLTSDVSLRYDRLPFERNYLYGAVNRFKMIMINVFISLVDWRSRKSKLPRSNFASINTSKRILVVFFHAQPEATTIPLGGIYASHTLWLLHLLAGMPSDWCMVIKEHPIQENNYKKLHFKYRDKLLSDLIKKNKNVKLLPKGADTHDLISISTAVATLTGTVAVEALMRGKPVFYFGYGLIRGAYGILDCKNESDVESAFLKAPMLSKDGIKNSVWNFALNICNSTETFKSDYASAVGSKEFVWDCIIEKALS